MNTVIERLRGVCREMLWDTVKEAVETNTTEAYLMAEAHIIGLHALWKTTLANQKVSNEEASVNALAGIADCMSDLAKHENLRPAFRLAFTSGTFFRVAMKGGAENDVDLLWPSQETLKRYGFHQIN